MQSAYSIPVIAYLIGSVPFGFLLIKAFQGKDIRSFGSGNIGATNVFRKSRLTGILTLILDAGKGYLAVAAASWLSPDPSWHAIAAAAAIAGHIFPLWLKFKGGKGVATGCGAFLALCPPAVGTTLVLFVLVLALTRYISAASIAATALFPLWAFLYGYPAPVLFWGGAGALLIVARHYQNIRRLLSGTESKFRTGSRSEQS
ncbi:MAG: glycerol-3-phosphate 1-O-acyltransferase PlsY [Acidobacteria bacterium]|nr:glycerol-3-phosphate 1-O-acyltransferase PlsY [Acidobacteriota bacterium]